MYTLYHIPGIKVGCSIQPDKRVRVQGYDSYEILETLSTIEEASEREIYWQKKLGYGRDTASTYIDTRRMASFAFKEEAKIKRKETMKTSELYKNSRGAMHSPQSRIKWIDTITASKAWEEGVYKSATNRKKIISQYTKEGKFIKMWPSATDVQKTLKIKKEGICYCLKGKQKTAGGFIWKYKR